MSMKSEKTEFIHFPGVGYQGKDIPLGYGYEYGSATIMKRHQTSCIIILWGGANTNIPIFSLMLNADVWSEWKRFDGTFFK